MVGQRHRHRQCKTMWPSAVPLVIMMALWIGAAEAKGGGFSGSRAGYAGGTTSRSGAGAYYSSGAGTGYYSAYGRVSSSGVAVPAGCRSCYYSRGSGLFYHRFFFISFYGRPYRCYSCGQRAGAEYDVEQTTITLNSIEGNVTVKFGSSADFSALEDSDSTTRIEWADDFSSHIHDQWIDEANFPESPGLMNFYRDLMPKGTAYVSTVKLTGPSSPAGCDPIGSPACTTTTAQVEFAALIDDHTLEPTSATVRTLLRSLQAGCDNETANASAIVRPSHYRSSIAWTVEDCATFSTGTVQLMMRQGDLIEPEEEDGGGWLGFLFAVFIIGCGCFCAYKFCKQRRQQQSKNTSAPRVVHQPQLATGVAMPIAQPVSSYDAQPVSPSQLTPVTAQPLEGQATLVQATAVHPVAPVQNLKGYSA